MYPNEILRIYAIVKSVSTLTFPQKSYSEGNAIKAANTPNLDKLMKTCPTTDIYTSGLNVGLPEGQMGNSEVGHNALGCGQIYSQPFVTNHLLI